MSIANPPAVRLSLLSQKKIAPTRLDETITKPRTDTNHLPEVDNLYVCMLGARDSLLPCTEF